MGFELGRRYRVKNWEPIAVAFHRETVRVVKLDADYMPVLHTRRSRMPIGQFIRRWARTPEGQEFIAMPRRLEPADELFVSLIRGMR